MYMCLCDPPIIEKMHSTALIIKVFVPNVWIKEKCNQFWSEKTEIFGFQILSMVVTLNRCPYAKLSKKWPKINLL